MKYVPNPDERKIFKLGLPDAFIVARGQDGNELAKTVQILLEIEAIKEFVTGKPIVDITTTRIMNKRINYILTTRPSIFEGYSQKNGKGIHEVSQEQLREAYRKPNLEFLAGVYFNIVNNYKND